jgi:hypothetical protein
MSEIKDTKRGPDRAMVERVNTALAKVNRARGAVDVGYSLSRPFGDDRSSTPTITGHTRLASFAKGVKR